MKAEEIPFLKNRVLELLPITQAEIWKDLKMERREISKLIHIMLSEDLITRKKYNKTFLLERNGHDDRGKKDFSLLLSKTGRFTPCAGCNMPCIPAACDLLDKWLSEC